VKEDFSTAGIRIISPRENGEVSGHLIVSGRYKNKPCISRLQLFVMGQTGEKGYYPQGVAIYDNNTEKTWRAECHIGGPSGTTATIVAALVGIDGKALCNYYGKIGQLVQQWHPIDNLTSDIIEMDRVNVVKK
jgi:hypothetical protein